MPKDAVLCTTYSDVKKQADPSKPGEHRMSSLEPCKYGVKRAEGKEMSGIAREEMERRLEKVKKEIEGELATRQEHFRVEAWLAKLVPVDEDDQTLEITVADARRAGDLEVDKLRRVLELEIKEATEENAEEGEIKELEVEMEGKLAMAIVRQARAVDGLRQKLEQDRRLRMMVAMEEAQDAFRMPMEKKYKEKEAAGEL
jgi:hypothetical protein